MHTPVFLKEAIDGLKVKKNGLYIDATFGEGGHSREIIRRGGRVLALEWDEETVRRHNSVIGSQNLLLKCGNYANIEKIAKKAGFYTCDGVIFDLGLSMEQLKFSKRGFSYRKAEEPLDMRINTSTRLKALDIINSYSEAQLYDIFASGSEELYSRAIAKVIVGARRIKAISKVGDLTVVIRDSTKSEGIRKEQICRRIFQALMIEVNNEKNNLKKGLIGALEIIKKGANMVIVTFHSGHERIVKQLIREKNLKSGVIRPKNTERRSFERSASIRIITKAV